MKLMYKSAALAAALILTAGISVQAQSFDQITTTGHDVNYVGGVSLVGGHIDATMGIIDTVQSDTVTADSVISKDITAQNQLNANKAVVVDLNAENVNAGSLTVNGKDVGETLGAHTNAIQGLQQQTQSNLQNITQANQARIEADNKLQSQIEVNGYKADTALKLEGNGVLYNHGTDLTTGINLNTSAIEQEEKDRVAADLQLQQGIQNNSNAISSLNSRVSDLGGEIDNVGAISAALAGLHPLNYDGTGSKFQLAAAMGDYDGSQAAAIGGFYHFNEDVMMSVGGATAFDGDKKAAFNVGVSFRVGSGSSAKRLNSDDVIAQLAAMNDKIAALEAENQKLTEKVAALQDSEAAPKA